MHLACMFACLFVFWYFRFCCKLTLVLISASWKLEVFRWRICILKQKISADVAEINLPDTKGHLICVSSSERFVKGSEEGARTGEQNRFFRDEVEHVQQLFKGVGLLHRH